MLSSQIVSQGTLSYYFPHKLYLPVTNLLVEKCLNIWNTTSLAMTDCKSLLLFWGVGEEGGGGGGGGKGGWSSLFQPQLHPRKGDVEYVDLSTDWFVSASTSPPKGRCGICWPKYRLICCTRGWCTFLYFACSFVCKMPSKNTTALIKLLFLQLQHDGKRSHRGYF